MPYRENDPKAGEEAENRAALERLAAVGLAKKAKLAADAQSAQLEARTRATSSRFRARAWASPRKGRFFGFWLVTCVGVAVVTAIVTLVTTRDLAQAIAYAIVAFIIANVSALTALPVAALYAIHAALWKRRDAVAFVAWSASLPFPFARFVETLSLDHSLNDIRVIVRFARGVPDATVLDGLVGNPREARPREGRSRRERVRVLRELALRRRGSAERRRRVLARARPEGAPAAPRRARDRARRAGRSRYQRGVEPRRRARQAREVARPVTCP